VINHVLGALSRGRGGWIATPNIDICQAAQRDPSLAELLAPRRWSCRTACLCCGPPGCAATSCPSVTGSSLIFSLSAAAARRAGRSTCSAGRPACPELAADRLAAAVSGPDRGGLLRAALGV
jgi:N-acetylglucosaminyldiphosphoundecaprenol N-acetyl-beta-D-mannosaminyltransferase